jgi:methionine-rich copper-binding protein CopC
MAAASLTMLACAFFAGTALAHTPIVSVAWDNPSSPTKLFARTDGSQIDNTPGSFYLRVYDLAGNRVDLGDAAVSASGNEIVVSVRPRLPAGTYRVDWKTTAKDGDADTGSLNIVIGAAAMPAGHEHEEEGEDHAHAGPALPAHDVTFEVQAIGAKIVPAPVTSTASAFARFTFHPSSSRLDYAVWVSGISPDQITGIHVHRGAANETGPHAFEILTRGPTDKVTFSGSVTLDSGDVIRLLEGHLYLQLHTTANPSGAARAQLILPTQQDHAAASAAIRPPSTGEVGLLTQTRGRPSELVLFLALLASCVIGLSVLSRKGHKA